VFNYCSGVVTQQCACENRRVKKSEESLRLHTIQLNF
jgi:hypothetical protein